MKEKANGKMANKDLERYIIDTLLLRALEQHIKVIKETLE